jgi:ketosteroid isomerase-like protein
MRQPKWGITMKVIGLTALAFSLILLSPPRLGAQQLDSAHREVWQTVEARWRAWQAGDLEKMLALYHPRFHAWNRVSGRLDGHDAVELYEKFAAVFYVSRETVKQIPVTTGAETVSAAGTEPTVVTIRWSDYLVKDGGRWLFVGYSGLPCSQSEPVGSACRSLAGK